MPRTMTQGQTNPNACLGCLDHREWWGVWQIEEALCQIKEAAATHLHLNVVKWGLPVSQEKLEMQILM